MRPSIIQFSQTKRKITDPLQFTKKRRTSSYSSSHQHLQGESTMSSKDTFNRPNITTYPAENQNEQVLYTDEATRPRFVATTDPTQGRHRFPATSLGNTQNLFPNQPLYPISDAHQKEGLQILQRSNSTQQHFEVGSPHKGNFDPLLEKSNVGSLPPFLEIPIRPQSSHLDIKPLPASTTITRNSPLLYDKLTSPYVKTPPPLFKLNYKAKNSHSNPTPTFNPTKWNTNLTSNNQSKFPSVSAQPTTSTSMANMSLEQTEPINLSKSNSSHLSASTGENPPKFHVSKTLPMKKIMSEQDAIFNMLLDRKEPNVTSAYQSGSADFPQEALPDLRDLMGEDAPEMPYSYFEPRPQHYPNSSQSSHLFEENLGMYYSNPGQTDLPFNNPALHASTSSQGFKGLPSNRAALFPTADSYSPFWTSTTQASPLDNLQRCMVYDPSPFNNVPPNFPSIPTETVLQPPDESPWVSNEMILNPSVMSLLESNSQSNFPLIHRRSNVLDVLWQHFSKSVDHMRDRNIYLHRLMEWERIILSDRSLLCRHSSHCRLNNDLSLSTNNLQSPRGRVGIGQQTARKSTRGTKRGYATQQRPNAFNTPQQEGSMSDRDNEVQKPKKTRK